MWLESLGTLQKSYEKNCDGGWGLGASHLAQIPADGGCGLLQVLHRTVPCTRGISCLTDRGGTWHFHPSLVTMSPGLLGGGLWLRKDGSEKLQALVHPLFSLRGQLAFIQDLRKQRRALKLCETTRMNS